MTGDEHIREAWTLAEWKVQEWWMESLGFGLRLEFNLATEGHVRD